MRVAILAFLVVLGPAAAVGAEVPCTYYAAPLQADGGRVPAGEPYAESFAVGTPDKPIPVSDFWDRKLVKPGTVLCLKDGDYRGKRSMLRPSPHQFAGRPDARVEIRAVNDGRVWIDGEFRHSPLRLAGHDYWTVRGVNVFNGRGPSVSIGGRKQTERREQEPTHHVVLQRIVAWRDYIPFGTEEDYEKAGGWNLHIFNLADVSDVLVEDCAGFGWARKVFQNYRSKRVVFRRNWARWDGRHPFLRGSQFAYSCSYSGYDALCENLIATVGGSGDPAAGGPDYVPGAHLIGIDGIDGAARWLEPKGRDPYDLGLRIRSSLAYQPPTSTVRRVGGVLIGGTEYPLTGKKGISITNTISAISEPGRPAATLNDCDDDPGKHPDGCSWQVKDDRAAAPLEVAESTWIATGRKPVRIGDDWKLEDVQLRPWSERGSIYRNAKGASLCHRSVDGVETREPLWPWPMQERIRQATERSRWPTADPMGEIVALFGEPPEECRSQ